MGALKVQKWDVEGAAVQYAALPYRCAERVEVLLVLNVSYALASVSTARCSVASLMVSWRSGSTCASA